MSNTFIIANNISVTGQGADLLTNISFCLQQEEHLAIIGPSGSGKTTLARVLAGLLFAKGNVIVTFDEYSSLRKKILFVEQRNQFKNLFHTSDFYYQQRYNSFDNNDAQTVWEALSVDDEQSTSEAKSLLKGFGLYERKEAPLIQLSSGENKRVQLIKAILSQPQILILDSPFTGLDAAARKYLFDIINQLANHTKIIVVTNAHQIPDCITHIALLEEGRLKQFGSKKELNTSDILQHSAYKLPSIYSLPLSDDSDVCEYVINMRDVTVKYEEKIILNSINWQVKLGDKWLLKGHNGAGKSTLLSLINGDNPQAYKNKICLFDKRRGSGESIWDIKQKIGFVSPELHAFYDKTTSCYNAIASGFWDTIGLFKKLSQQQHKQVQQWIDFLDLSAVCNKALFNLSFGTQRMILLARAMVKNPPLLILDEPCQGLDDEQKESFVALVNDICEQSNKTLIYVSHYDDELPACIEKVLELKRGEQRIYSIKKKETEVS